jgi:hypothetical protein
MDAISDLSTTVSEELLKHRKRQYTFIINTKDDHIKQVQVLVIKTRLLETNTGYYVSKVTFISISNKTIAKFTLQQINDS